MKAKHRGNAAIAQSGGPTAVINASLAGAIEQSRKCSDFGRIYGGLYGVSGLIRANFADLTDLTDGQLEVLAATPSAALGSSRHKPSEADCRQILSVFQKKDIRYFFCIGGDDSARTALIVHNAAKEAGYELRTVHIPKTIDNDLLISDHSPGYGSAARFIAYSVTGDDLENRALPGIKIDIVMGRHAGFLAASAALAKTDEGAGPHLIYLPERPLALADFVEQIEDVYRRLGRCLAVVAQGIRDVDGVCWDEKIQTSAGRDPHGNLEFSGTGTLAAFLARHVATGLKVKRVRADTFGYLQRSFPALQSEVDLKEAMDCGHRAVEFACEGQGGSVAIRRISNYPEYESQLFLAALEEVAGGTRQMPDDFINAAGNGVTDAFLAYATPLVGTLPLTCSFVGGPIPR